MASHLFGSRVHIAMASHLFGSRVPIASLTMTLRHRDDELVRKMATHLSVPDTRSSSSIQSVKDRSLTLVLMEAFCKNRCNRVPFLLSSAQTIALTFVSRPLSIELLFHNRFCPFKVA